MECAPLDFGEDGERSGQSYMHMRNVKTVGEILCFITLFSCQRKKKQQGFNAAIGRKQQHTHNNNNNNNINNNNNNNNNNNSR
jgi:hypothetical protein